MKEKKMSPLLNTFFGGEYGGGGQFLKFFIQYFDS
jgi:hypothetical protein